MKRIFLKVGSKRDGSWKLEAGSWKLEAGSDLSEVKKLEA
jgi:hypothetical protein